MSAVSLIDLGATSDSATGREVAGRIDRACREIGFFGITGHGVPVAVIDDVWRAARDFFDLPLAVNHHVTGSSPVRDANIFKGLGGNS